MNPKIIFALLFLCASLFIVGCPGKNNPAAPSNPPTSQATPIESNSSAITVSVGGSVTLKDGTQVAIPANTLSQNATISISKYNTSDVPSINTSYQPLSYTYKFDSGSATFTGSVTITLPYNPSTLPNGVLENDLAGQYYDGVEWIVVDGTVDTVNHAINIPTQHFSDWCPSYNQINVGVATSSSAYLNIPYYYQGNAPSQWCADTSLSMVLRYYKSPLENCDVAAYFKQGFSTGLTCAIEYCSQVKDYLTSVSYSCDHKSYSWIYNNNSKLLTDLEKNLSAGRPVIVGASSADHFFVVTGFDNSYFYINDPSGQFIKKITGSDPGPNVLEDYPITPTQFENGVTGFLNGIVSCIDTFVITNGGTPGSKTGSEQILPNGFLAINSNDSSDALTFVWDGNTYANGYGYAASKPSSRTTNSTFGYSFTDQDKVSFSVFCTNLTNAAKSFGVTVRFLNTSNNQQYQGVSITTGSIPQFGSNYSSTLGPITLTGFTQGNYNMIVDLYDGTTLTDTITKKFYLGTSATPTVTPTFATPTATSTISPTWQVVGTAGFSPNAVFNTSLVFDSGTPYVLYQDNNSCSPSCSFALMKFNGTSWGNVSSFSNGQVFPGSLVFHNGMPYVVYEDTINGNKATVVMNNGSSWVNVGNSDFSAGSVDETQITFDGNTPYVAYRDTSISNGSFLVMTYNGSSWVSVGDTTATAGGTLGELAVNSGTLYLVYQLSGNNYPVSVLMYNGSSWATAGNTAISGGSAYSVFSLALNNGTPYLAYGDPSNGYASVMMNTGGSWINVGTTDFSPNYIQGLSLAFYNGSPYVAYEDGTTYKATVMMYSGTNWVNVGNPNFSTSSAFGISLAINNGTPYVAFEDSANGDKMTVMKFQ